MHQLKAQLLHLGRGAALLPAALGSPCAFPEGSAQSAWPSDQSSMLAREDESDERKSAEGKSGEGDPRVRVPNAQSTIARQMPAFKRCFETNNAFGRVSLTLVIVSDGNVSHASVEGPVSRLVAQCIETYALRTVFNEPEGGRTARLLVPVAVIRQYS